MNLVFPLSPKKITRFLLGIVCVLCLVSLFTVTLSEIFNFPVLDLIARLFDVNTERNIPTIFSVMSFWVAGFLCGFITFIKKLRKERYVMHWFFLGLIFIYLGWDDAVQIHETLNKSDLSRLFAHDLGVGASGLFTFDWLIVAMPIVFLIGLIYLKFIWSLPIQQRKLLILAAALFLGGTVFMEMVGGWIWDNISGHQVNFIYTLADTLEEALEMSGVIVFIYSLLLHLSLYIDQITLNFIKGDEPILSQNLIDQEEYHS